MLKDYILLLRPKHWIKNVFLFAGIVFGKKLLGIEPFVDVVQGFVCFCGLSSVAYIFNDLRDVEADRQHRLKKNRPLAAGKISPTAATLLGIVLMGAMLGWAFWLGSVFGITLPQPLPAAQIPS